MNAVISNCRTETGSGTGERGSLFLGTLFIVVVTAMAAAGIVRYVQQGIRTERLNASYTKAHYIAQGAMNRAVGELAPDANQLAVRVQEAPQTGSLGTGTYTLTYTALADGTTRIDALATCDTSTALLRLYAKPEGGIEGIFAKSMMSEQNIFLRDTSSVTNNGDVHSNNNVTAYDSAYVSGDMTAVGTADPTTATVDGTVTSGAPYEDYPQIDYDYYYQIAAANGQVLTGDQKFSASMSPINPPGGVLYIDGDVMISDEVVINGSIIATGDIIRVSGPEIKIDAGGVDLFSEDNLDIPADTCYLSSGHTNADLAITGDVSDALGTFTYVGTVTITSGGTIDTLKTDPETMPTSPLTLEELKTLALEDNAYFVGDILLVESVYGVSETNSGRIINNGSVICATGRVSVVDNNFRRDVTLVSETSDVVINANDEVTMMPSPSAASILIYAKNGLQLLGQNVRVAGILVSETGNFYFKGDKNGRASEGSFWAGGSMYITGDYVDLGNIGNATSGDGSEPDPTAYINAPTFADGTVAPALVSIGGNIDMVDEVNVTGLIYTGSGTFSSTTAATKEYRGAIYSWGDIEFASSSQLTYDESYVQIGQGLIYEPPYLVELAYER